MLILAIRCQASIKLSAQIVPIKAGKYSPLASLEFRRRTQQDKLDLFHSPFYVMPLLECPVIVTVHDLIPFLFPIYPWPKQQMVKAGYRRGGPQGVAYRHGFAANSK